MLKLDTTFNHLRMKTQREVYAYNIISIAASGLLPIDAIAKSTNNEFHN